MFRDLKEYQEIAKIYADKVSKPEDLDERVRGGGVPSGGSEKKFTPTPQKGMGGGTGNPTNRRGSGARPRPEKKMSNIPVIDGPVNNPEYGKNMSRDEKDLNPPKDEKTTTMSTKDKFKSKFIKKDKGVGFVKRGTPGAQRAENKEKAKLRAQAMARANIEKKKAAMTEGMAGALIKGGSKLVPALMTGIGAVGTMMQSKKKQGTKGGQGFGGEKPANAEVKAPKKVKKPRLNIGKRASGRDRNFIQGGGAGGMESVEYDAYDLVLEYLLSTEQAATIEEANYIMTEMDAKTIQSIVAE